MTRRCLTILLVLALLMGAMACPAAMAAESASARTMLSGASDAQRTNILAAAEALNGTRVDYGESFSFNETVGPRTKARGYVSAENGRGAVVTGGGVAQVATTLYLALLDVPGSIRFDALSTYGRRFTGSYVSDGDLAVITDYGAGTDFAFTNYASDLTIELWSNDDYLYCAVTLGGESADSGGWFDGWSAATQAPEQAAARIATASIPLSDDAAVRANVSLAAGSAYDTTLATGDLFSFNRVVGPRTAEYGYVRATNGRGVEVVGGGVAQVASAIWLAVKDLDDIAIVEKSTYGKKYNQHYVQSSADAIVTDYKAGTDFSFRYTGDGSITLYTYVDGDSLRCDVMWNG